MRREFSNKVKAAAFLRASGKCERCPAKLDRGKFHYDHEIPDALGGEPVLENCVVLCVACHKDKTTTKDVPAIAKTKRIQYREMGIRKPSKFRSAPFRKSPPQRSASRPLERRS